MIDLLADSPNPNHKKLSQSLIIAKNWDEYDEMVFQVKNTGLFAQIGTEIIKAYIIIIIIK